MTTRHGISAKSLTVHPYFTVAGVTFGRAADFVSLRWRNSWEICVGRAMGEPWDYQALFIRGKSRRHWKFKSRLLARLDGWQL